MSITLFLELLFAFSLITSLTIEAIKKITKNFPYNLAAFIIAIVIGVCGTFVYYQLNNISFNLNNIIYSLLLGLTSGLCSTLGYDKVKETIEQILTK